MIPFTEQAKWYAQYHQKDVTKYTHMAGIPLLMFSFLILLGLVHIVVPGVLDIRLSDIAVIVLLIYYFRLQWLLALVLTPILIFLLWLANLFTAAGPTPFAIWSFIIVFSIGLVAQIAGHILEGKLPAITDNIKYDLASPLFLTAEIFFMMGKMQGLKEKIHGKHEEPVQVHIEKE